MTSTGNTPAVATSPGSPPSVEGLVERLSVQIITANNGACDPLMWEAKNALRAQQARLSALTAERDRMAEALKPFAEDYDENWSPESNGGRHFEGGWCIANGETHITVSDLRAARQALQSDGRGE